MPIDNPITLDVQKEIGAALPLSAESSRTHVGVLLNRVFAGVIGLEETYGGLDPWLHDILNADGLDIAFRDGRVCDGKGSFIDFEADTVALAANDTNYIEVHPEDGLQSNTSDFTDGSWPLAVVETGASGFLIENVTDARALYSIAHGPVVDAANLDDAVSAHLEGVDVEVGAEVSDEVAISIQVVDANGDAIAGVHVLEIWLADNTGEWETASAPSGTLATPFTEGDLLEVVSAGKRWIVQTNDEGLIETTLEHDSAGSWFLHVLLSGGRIAVSDEMEFTS